MLAQPARSERSFERLYRRHAADVYRYAFAILQNRADAEDVTQTTFMNAYRALERGDRPERPHNWLIAIAHNVCRQRFRQSQRRPNEVEWQDDLADHLVADDETPTAEDIRRALSHLPFNQRAALVMRELEGRSYAEIGELLELSTAAVETLIFRARRALREQLEGTLTCGDAELAISKQLDGRLSRAEKGQLRAHLRECPECASFARRQRAQRTALKSLGSIPLPASLASLFGGGGTPAAVVAAKAVAVAAAAAVAGGASYEAVRTVEHPHPHAAAVRATVEHAAVAPAATTQLAAPVDVRRPVAPPRGEHARAKHTRSTHAGGGPRSGYTGHGRGHGAIAHVSPPESSSSAASAHAQGSARSAAATSHGHANGRGAVHASQHAANAHGSSVHSGNPHGTGKPSGSSSAGKHGSGSHSSGSGPQAQPAPAATAPPAPAPGPPQTPPGRSGQAPPGKHGASFSP